MSNLTVKGNASGTGTVILEAPNTNSNRTITLPDAATTLVGTADFASQAQAEAGTDNTTLMTPLRTEEHMTANALGWGQTWQDVSGSRAASVSYQNTTGRPIQVAFNTSTGTIRDVEVSPDNTTWVTVARLATTAITNASFIVPNGYYYRINGSITSVNSWSELR